MCDYFLSDKYCPLLHGFLYQADLTHHHLHLAMKTDNVLVGNSMVAVELTKGIHTVELRYENKAFEYGSLISFACAAVFGGIVLADYLRKRKKGNR